jgi:hypothetical protein
MLPRLVECCALFGLGVSLRTSGLLSRADGQVSKVLVAVGGPALTWEPFQTAVQVATYLTLPSLILQALSR